MVNTNKFLIFAYMKDRRAYRKAYREANKDKIAAKRREYYLANKDKENSYNNAYRKANRDKLNKHLIDRYHSLSHKPLVYLIVRGNYVGISENLEYRLSVHKNKSNRDISEVIILCECETRKEALEMEAALHKEGYIGSRLKS